MENIIDENLPVEAQVISNQVIEYPKLFKLNGSGKVLTWYLQRDKDKYRTISGQQDGKKTVSKWTVAKPKNVGKKNATTGEEQAIKEIESKYEKKQKSGGYVDDITNAKQFTYLEPMLARVYYDITYNPETGEQKVKDNRPSFEEIVYVQPKLDGVRCIASKDGLFTRKGEKILGVPHIEENLKPFFGLYDIILDGELYIHEVEFNELNGTIRRDPEEDDKDQTKVRSSIKYFVYDIVDTETEYEYRASVLKSLESNLPEGILNLNSNIAADKETVDKLHDYYVSLGYEGVMVRTKHALYQPGKRSKDLLKVKRFTDSEFTIVDILEGEGNNSGIAAKVAIEDNGVTVFPNMTGSWDFCKEVLEQRDEYLGGQVTVKYFGRTPDGSLRFPAVIGIYKEERDM